MSDRIRSGRRRAALAVLALGGWLLTGCAAPPQPGFGARDIGAREGIGTLLGAGTGAYFGSKIGGGRGKLAAVSIGTLLGAYAGNRVGRSLDEADRLRAAHAHYDSLEFSPTGRPVSWHNPDSGRGGSITPTRTYAADDGRSCREYATRVRIDGATEQAYGTACRQPDGRWQVVN